MKNKNETREILLNLRVTTKENTKLEKQAKKFADGNVSRLLRESALNRKKL